MPDKPSSNKKIVIVGAAGILLGFLIGFKLADALNKPELDSARAEVARLSGGEAKGASKTAERAADNGGEEFPTLTNEQLANAVAQADAAPKDVELQRKVGKALYAYASSKRNTAILTDVARILRRAHELDQKDHSTAVMAGDAQFFVERSGGGDPKLLAEARRLYEAALALQPNDAVVRTKLGLTYFYDKPPNIQRAISEYRHALQSDPRQEFAIQSLAAALIETGGLEEAARRLDELEKMNPSNTELPGLRAQLEQQRNAAKEK